METIKLHCTDNGKDVTAEVIDRQRKRLVVLVGGTLRLQLHQNFKKGNVFVGNINGLEFVYEGE